MSCIPIRQAPAQQKTQQLPKQNSDKTVVSICAGLGDILNFFPPGNNAYFAPASISLQEHPGQTRDQSSGGWFQTWRGGRVDRFDFVLVSSLIAPKIFPRVLVCVPTRKKDNIVCAVYTFIHTIMEPIAK